MKVFITTLALLITACASAADIDQSAFNFFGETVEPPKVVKRSAYMTYREAFTLAKREGKGLLVARQVDSTQHSLYASSAKARNLIFCVVDDNDEMFPVGIKEYGPPIGSVVRQPVMVPQRQFYMPRYQYCGPSG